MSYGHLRPGSFSKLIAAKPIVADLAVLHGKLNPQAVDAKGGQVAAEKICELIRVRGVGGPKDRLDFGLRAADWRMPSQKTFEQTVTLMTGNPPWKTLSDSVLIH